MKPIRPIHDKNLSNLQDVQDRVHTILNGNVSNGGDPWSGGFLAGPASSEGNTDSVHIKVQAGTAGVEFAVTHNLNRIPTGFRVANRNNAGNCFDSGTIWTKTQIFLKCDVTGTQFNLEIY